MHKGDRSDVMPYQQFNYSIAQRNEVADFPNEQKLVCITALNVLRVDLK